VTCNESSADTVNLCGLPIERDLPIPGTAPSGAQTEHRSAMMVFSAISSGIPEGEVHVHCHAWTACGVISGQVLNAVLTGS